MVIMDSVEKIVTRYFSAVTAEEFEYGGKTYPPRTLKVSPYLFRGFTCPAHCGACCKRYTLDYLPRKIEKHPYKLKKRLIDFDGRQVPIWSDLNDDHDSYYCRNVNTENGRCMIHGSHAFSCDFELVRFLNFASADMPKKRTTLIDGLSGSTANVLTTKLYGRGHAMLKVDGNRGSMCEVTEPTDETMQDVLRKMKRLKQWCEHFGLVHKLDRIIAYVQEGPRADTLFV